ncbi:NIPA-like protein 2 [Sphaceloma murrayae]|uniref:NIPA-like protein 2 n=1 Tax=Sphaceloma murrayae TaxID=2082308 RepID=A0A2K1QHW2_9PEZI|nr:NIPA-like protein 2 [Sphaceloma murrayae]
MASLSPGGTVAFGVVVGLISTCVQSVGLTLQRKSHILEEEKAEHLPKRAPYRRRRWQIGMFLFLLSNIVGSSIQITTLPLPLLSTLQASGLVFNALLASLLLHEPFTRRTLFGTLLVAAGALLISFFSALPEPSHTLQQLLDLLVVKGFLIWFTLTMILVLGITILTVLMTRLLPPHRLRSPRTRLLRGMSYGLISGVLSAHALLLAKSAVELLIRTVVDKKNQFKAYQSWLLLLLFLFLALTQLYYLHHGLRLVSTSILYPFVFCVYNIIAILDGLIYFRQTDRLPALHGGLIGLGTFVLLTGVLSLSWRLSEETNSPGRDAESGIKADLPHSALTPGMGLVDEETNDVHTPLRSYFDDPASHYRDDASDDDSAFPDLLDNASDDVIQQETNERDPLLAQRPRSRTGVISRRRPANGRQDAVSRRRRSTIKEVQLVWDELRDQRNWFPPSLGTSRSPRTSFEQGRRQDEESGALISETTSEDRASPGQGQKRVSWLADTPTRPGFASVEQRRAKATRDKRRTMPPSYTFQGAMNAIRSGVGVGMADEGDARQGVKRTVSWGQGSTGAGIVAERERRPESAGAVDKASSQCAFNASDQQGASNVPRPTREEEIFGRVGNSRVNTSDRRQTPEEERRKSSSSVKLEWWRKRRRDS